jgi:hypothetical protein
MRYSPHSFLVLATLGPVLLALAWFLVIFARYAAPPILRNLGNYFLYPGLGITFLLVLYSTIAERFGSQRRTMIASWQVLVLCSFEFLALWHWTWLLCLLVGWLFIWGDNTPFLSEGDLAFIACIIAAGITAITAARMRGHSVPRHYPIIIGCLTATLIVLAIPFCMRFLR